MDVSWSRSTMASLSGSRRRYWASRSATGWYGIFGRCSPNTSAMAFPRLLFSAHVLRAAPTDQLDRTSGHRPAQLHHPVELQVLAEARNRNRHFLIELLL